jgi:hypothetical protein
MIKQALHSPLTNHNGPISLATPLARLFNWSYSDLV